MRSTQYTIRSIPPNLDKALRKQARDSGKSLNEVSVEALAKGAGLSKHRPVFTDLDWLIGSSKKSANELDESQKWINKLPQDLDNLV